jgi:hypothetical protein
MFIRFVGYEVSFVVYGILQTALRFIMRKLPQLTSYPLKQIKFTFIS